MNGINITFPADSYIEYYQNATQNYTGLWYPFIDSISFGNTNTFQMLLGDSFLRNYYVYHDFGNYRLGLYSPNLPIPAKLNRNLSQKSSNFLPRSNRYLKNKKIKDINIQP